MENEIQGKNNKKPKYHYILEKDVKNITPIAIWLGINVEAIQNQLAISDHWNMLNNLIINLLSAKVSGENLKNKKSILNSLNLIEPNAGYANEKHISPETWIGLFDLDEGTRRGDLTTYGNALGYYESLKNIVREATSLNEAILLLNAQYPTISFH